MTVDIYYREWDGKNDSHEYLNQAIQQYYKTRGKSCPGDLTFARNGKFGKPYMEELPDLYFSISHSGIWWFCAIAEEEIGLDVQEPYTRKQEKLARRFFHPDEVLFLEQCGFEQFSRFWTYKESYVKYTGVGLLDGLDYFSVVDAQTGEMGVKGVCQQEVPFQDDFWVVLTSKKGAETKLIPLTSL